MSAHAHSEKLLKQLTGVCCKDRHCSKDVLVQIALSRALMIINVKKFEGGQLERISCSASTNTKTDVCCGALSLGQGSKLCTAMVANFSDTDMRQRSNRQTQFCHDIFLTCANVYILAPLTGKAN